MKQAFSKESNIISLVSSLISLIVTFLISLIKDKSDEWKFWVIAIVIIAVGYLLMTLINYLILSNKKIIFRVNDDEIDVLIYANSKFMCEIKKIDVSIVEKRYYAIRLLDNIEKLKILIFKNDNATKTKYQRKCVIEYISFLNDYSYLLEKTDENRLLNLKRENESILKK